jgi:hypothetical protein
MSAKQLKGRTVCVLVEVSNVAHPQVMDMGGGGSVITMGDCHIILQEDFSWIIVGNVFADFTKE